MKTSQEAKAKGLPLAATCHSMLRRAPWHDYSRKGLYMITLVVEPRRPILGELLGEPFPHVRLSNIGHRILNEEFPKIHQFYPNAEVWKAVIMPDHIHFIVYVRDEFPEGKSLANVVIGFKTGCNRAYREIYNLESGSLFAKGYNDKILLHPDRLDCWKRYLDDNPRRLCLKTRNPNLFTIMHNQPVAEKNCQLVGNVFLLDAPEKEAVIYHRHYSDNEWRALCKQWLRCSEAGGALVSAAIHKAEKDVMREAMNLGYRMILLRENGFHELYKPAGESFDACAQGRLLQISPWLYHIERKTISREQCLFLNNMAEAIAMSRESYSEIAN